MRHRRRQGFEGLVAHVNDLYVRYNAVYAYTKIQLMIYISCYRLVCPIYVKQALLQAHATAKYTYYINYTNAPVATLES